MKVKSLLIRAFALLMIAAMLGACSARPAGGMPPASGEAAPAESVAGRSADWTEATHGDQAEPNYAVVFPQDKVNQITITIDAASWEAMQANMTDLLGEPGSRGDPGGMGMQPPEGGQMPAIPEGGLAGGMPGGDIVAENPMWVAADITFAGQTWTSVGVRYKGNSSLMSGWNSGTGKLPFKLDFDQFEDTVPAVENQRFYGFKQLSLSNNSGDATGMRETIAYDLMESSGLIAAETAAVEVLLDHGGGPQSLGLYTLVEVVDDTAIERALGDDSGNIYEGDGAAASLAAGTEDQLTESFQKENNDEAADWSDIEALYAVINSAERTSDPAAWRAKLEAIFDVPAFLKWLGVSAVLEHWDTYGAMTHNYYLYSNPATGKLTWISWDHNFVLGASMGMGDRMGGPPGMQAPASGAADPVAQNAPGRRGGMAGRQNVTFDKKNVNEGWPLIRYLLDDPTYSAAYVAALKETASAFDAPALIAKYQSLAAVIAPVAAAETSQADYDAAVKTLTERITRRAADLETFLAAQ
ncbi:MAG TPA: CotH kinase family protein [Herpetosiphonaceae bacterium]|nr:CotH kinase family protein [Herpetosiphonaceae bacterium]